MGSTIDFMKKSIAIKELRLAALKKKYKNANTPEDFRLANKIKEETDTLEGMETLLKLMEKSCGS